MLVAVGDIHAYKAKLDDLMSKLADRVDFSTTPLIFLGDYVDGGPDAKAVVEQLMAWERQYPHWVFLYGNHEDLMLDALVHQCKRYGNYYVWYGQGGKETLDSYFKDAGLSLYEKAISQPRDWIPSTHLTWLADRPFFHETDKFFFVHAGVEPGVDPIMTDVENMIWIRDEFIDSDDDWGKRIVYGHTYNPEPVVQPNKIGIDTMTHSRGHLTAVLLDDSTGDVVDFIQSFET
jgi:serine/threonine protein phosphatase 1